MPVSARHAHHLDPLDALSAFIKRHPRLFVLTGAGCSTDSGIPDYRDRNGDWKHRQPVRYHSILKFLSLDSEPFCWTQGPP